MLLDRGRMSRAIKRTILVAVFTVAALIVVSGVHLKWTPAPAIVSSVALSGTQDGTLFESDVIQTDATIAGLSWKGNAPDAIWIRSSVDGVEWTEWIELGIQPDHGPDPGSDEAKGEKPASEPAFFGPVSYLQYRVEDTSTDFTSSAAGRFTAEVVETSGRGLSLQQKAVRLVESIELGTGSEAEGVPGTPNIISNETWGGPQCIANAQPRKLPLVHRAELAIVHHAGNNTYSSGQGARDLIYSICSYHVSSRGWWDIAYNFLVDRYGNIYEGRRGSTEEQVRGGHTAGFNSYSVGVAMLGNFELGTPTQSSVNALEDFLDWRMNMHHIPASGVVTVESLGSDKWDEGVNVEFYRIAGHRDAKHTACPGTYCYSLLPGIRTRVAASGEPKFSLDFSNFDPVVPGTPGDLLLHAPAGAPWTVTATQRLGPTVWSTSGSGPQTVTWDAPVPPGPYTITVDFGPLGINEQVIQVGNYEWPFVDDEGSYAVSEIEDMWTRNVTYGCDWDRFCPKASLTRAEIATFVARAMDGEDRYPAYAGDYSDVPSGRWYTGAIEFLVDEGVLSGGGGVFGVNELSTRVLVVDLILGALGDRNYPSYQGYFTDVPEGMWYTQKVERAYELGIALGFPDGSFQPEGYLTREEAAAFVMRGLE